MSLFGEPSSKQQVSDFGTSTPSLSTRRIPTGRLCLKIEPPANLTDVTFPPNSPHDQQPSPQRVRCAAAVEKSLEMIVMVLLRGDCIPTIGVVRSTVRTRRHRSRARWRDSLPVISCHLTWRRSVVRLCLVVDWKETDLIARQSLFTVYVNSKAYNETEESSIFTEHVILKVMNTENGYAQFTLVAATLRMLQAALENPLNRSRRYRNAFAPIRAPFRKFVLLSESCVPIHPPELIHAQLITEPRSRLNACRHGQRNLGRWVCSFRILFFEARRDGDRWNHKLVDYKIWRKSSQFIALKRTHAALAAEDAELSARFRQYCFTTWSPIRNLCVADEHYFPTLIAYHGRENQVFLRWVASAQTDDGTHGSQFCVSDRLPRICDEFRMERGSRSVASHFL